MSNLVFLRSLKISILYCSELVLIACVNPLSEFARIFKILFFSLLAEYQGQDYNFRGGWYDDTKAQLNDLLKDYVDINEETLKKIAIPFMTIMGLDCEIYTIRLVASGLYAIDIVHTMVFPSNIAMLKDSGIKKLMEGLWTIKSLCLNVVEVKNEKVALNRSRLERHQKDLRGFTADATVSKIEWSRYSDFNGVVFN